MYTLFRDGRGELCIMETDSPSELRIGTVENCHVHEIHLSRQQAVRLARILRHWIVTGKIRSLDQHGGHSKKEVEPPSDLLNHIIGVN